METLQITQDAIRYGNELHPTKNISSARMVERQVLRRAKGGVWLRHFLIWLVIGLVLLVLGMRSSGLLSMILTDIIGFSSYGRNFYRFLSFALLVAQVLGGLALLRGVIPPKRPRTEYGVELQNTAGRVSLFWSERRDFIEQIRDLVFKAISGSGSANVNYSINIEKQEINDNSTNLTSTTIINDYSVHFTENHGVSPEQLAYLNAEVSRAVRDLGKVFEESRNTDGREELLELVEALRVAKPGNNTGLRKAWSRVKGACNDYSGASTAVQDLLSVIGKGVELFL